jgi:predicted site-specific integrase-resolvase
MKISKELADEIAKHLENGNFAKTILEYVGVNQDIFYKWKKEGKILTEKIENKEVIKSTLTPYQKLLVYFFETISKASQKAIMRNVSLINKAAIDDWKAASWFLERRDWKNWGRKDFLKKDVKVQIIKIKPMEIPKDGN